jgi:hypothetical protein
MPLKLQRDARGAVLRDARAHAQLLGSPTIEAEHLLLALAMNDDSAVGQLLAGSGLDRDGILDALERARARGLACAGVTVSDFSQWDGAPPPRRTPKLAASAKQSIVRAISAARRRRDPQITSTHLLIGILGARLGTVPRALEASGIDRGELAAQAEQNLR